MLPYMIQNLQGPVRHVNSVMEIQVKAEQPLLFLGFEVRGLDLGTRELSSGP